ncbi:MAG: hypothetical protein NVSMB45_05960 [Ginsengibacter sp.]
MLTKKYTLKTEKNYIDYGIYIDRKKSFVIALNHVVHESILSEDMIENPETGTNSDHGNRQENAQNHANEELKKFCKLIISKLEHPHHILVFGPSTTKFQLQKEIQNSKELKFVGEELLVTDNMEKEAAVQYVKDHFTPITIGQQVFTGSKN